MLKATSLRQRGMPELCVESDTESDDEEAEIEEPPEYISKRNQTSTTRVNSGTIGEEGINRVNRVPIPCDEGEKAVLAKVLQVCLKEMHALNDDNIELIVFPEEGTTPRTVLLEEVRSNLQRWLDPMCKEVASLEWTDTITRVLCPSREQKSAALPAKIVAVEKPDKDKIRIVACGNFAAQNDVEVYSPMQMQ